MDNKSIFNQYYNFDRTLLDIYKEEDANAVDVIIPLFNTNELWEHNLYNIYKTIPIKRLLIGDGGCTDNSIEIVKQFPRVTVYNHRHFKTLGGSLKELIGEIQTERFVYLHSDISLPDGWFEKMLVHKEDFDWYECPHRATVLIDYSYDEDKINRALSGAQMGSTSVLKSIAKKIEDDYLYRNEDIVLAELVENDGYKYGKVRNTFHYHQAMNKNGELEPKYESITINKVTDRKWEIDTYTKQVFGIVKYLQPNKVYLHRLVNQYILKLIILEAWDWEKYLNWVKKHNAIWLKYSNRKAIFIENVIEIGKLMLLLLKKTFKGKDDAK